MLEFLPGEVIEQRLSETKWPLDGREQPEPKEHVLSETALPFDDIRNLVKSMPGPDEEALAR